MSTHDERRIIMVVIWHIYVVHDIKPNGIYELKGLTLCLHQVMVQERWKDLQHPKNYRKKKLNGSFGI